MATKIRLQRHGRKGYAFFHVVVADSRSKRDGRYIEKLGTYNPNTNPATVDIDFDRTLNWVKTGAEMTDTARAILSYRGILYKNHLLKGVKKGALTEEQAEKKFEEWLKKKDEKISKKSEGIKTTEEKEKAARLAAEKEVSDARAKEIAAKNTPEVEEAPEAEAKPESEEAKEEPKTEEEPKAEVKEEEPKAKEEPEPKKEEPKKEEPKAEAKDDSKAKEEPKEEKEENKEKSAE